MMRDGAPSKMGTFLAIFIPLVTMIIFVGLIFSVLEKVSRNTPPRLQKGDEIIVITDHGQYSLFFHTEGDFLKCTDKEGKIHFFRGNYEVHQRSELSPEVVDRNNISGDLPPFPQTLLR